MSLDKESPRLSGQVLVVDPDPARRQATCVFLDGLGIRVLASENGSQAIEVYLQNPLDLILSIADMTPVSGADLSRMVRMQDSGLSIALCASDASPEARTVLQEAGANAVLGLPWSVDELVELLRTHLPNAGLAAERDAARASIHEVSDALRARFLESLQVSYIEPVLDAFAGSDWKTLKQRAHRAYGTSATLRFANLAASARALELYLSDLPESSDPDISRLEALVDALQIAATASLEDAK